MIKKYKKQLIILLDALLVPALIICERLTDSMLQKEDVCLWIRLGGKCATCGGTHFVNSLLNGHIIEAFHHNQYLFFLAIYLALTLLLINAAVLLDKKTALDILKGMYSVTAVIVICSLLLVFLILRNIPLWERLAHLFMERL